MANRTKQKMKQKKRKRQQKIRIDVGASIAGHKDSPRLVGIQEAGNQPNSMAATPIPLFAGSRADWTYGLSG